MNITREDMPGRRVALLIELDPETVNTALDRAYRQMVGNVNIPGFRRGKAPRYMVERYLGPEALTERAVQNILPKALEDAISEQNLEYFDMETPEIVNMDPVTVKVVIVQPPSVELGDYGTIRVEREKAEVTPEQSEQVLAELRRENVPWAEPAEPRPIKEGDMVYLDLEGFAGSGELPEAKRENFPTIVGLGRAGVPAVVNKALEGMQIDEEKDVTDTLPDDYPNEELRGRDVSYHVKVLSMKEQNLPEVNDEWSKTLGFDTVDALKEAIDRNLHQRADESTESNQVNSIIAQLVEGSKVDVPDAMIEKEIDAAQERLENRLKEQRITLRQYLTFNGMNEKEWRDANRQAAQERVVRGLVLEAFATREGIAVEDEEVASELDKMLEAFGEDEREAARNVLGGDEARSELQDRVFNRKIVERLTAIGEGRAEAAPADTSTGPEAAAEDTEAGEETPADDSADDTGSTATDLEEAGGAAELLGTEGVDTQSPNETGEASGGGTPSSAPALNKKKSK